MRLATRIFLIFVLLTMIFKLSGCGTISGAAQGLSDDVIDLMKFSYKVL